MKACSASALVPLFVVAGVALVSLLSAGCPGAREPLPVGRCYDDCRARASERCDDDACDRGCKFILDRVVEREDGPIVSCVAKSAASSACGDAVWADCAARVGIHADGGPPNAAPPPDEASADERDDEEDAKLDGGSDARARTHHDGGAGKRDGGSSKVDKTKPKGTPKATP